MEDSYSGEWTGSVRTMIRGRLLACLIQMDTSGYTARFSRSEEVKHDKGFRVTMKCPDPISDRGLDAK